MSFKKIITVFYIGLPLCVVLRVLQIAKTVEYENGFFVEEQKALGTVLTVLIALICAVVVFCSKKAYKTPEEPPKSNIFLSVSAVLVAVSLFNEALNSAFPVTVAPWQIGVTRLVTIISAIYFIIIALGGFVPIKIAPPVHIIPIAYAMLKTVFTFIGVSPLALISDNILLMAGYCLLMLFFINYGKLYNGLDTELNFRKILATGLTAALICVSQSAAYLLINIFCYEKYLHSDINVIFTLLFMGLYSLVFVVFHFHEGANKKRVRHKSKHTRLQ